MPPPSGPRAATSVVAAARFLPSSLSSATPGLVAALTFRYPDSLAGVKGLDLLPRSRGGIARRVDVSFEVGGWLSVACAGPGERPCQVTAR